MKLLPQLAVLLIPLLSMAGSLADAQPLLPEGAADAQMAAAPAEVQQVIVASLKESRPTLTFESVSSTPIPGIYAVKVANGPTLYSTADGRYFVLGDLFEVTSAGYTNIAEKQRESERAEKLAAIPLDEMIVFSPEEKPAKASVMVFTDVDCFYCQKLHKEVPDLNRIGIEVRYLAFPRAGIGSESYKKIATAWCSSDPQSALTKLKNRERLPLNVCPNNPVEKEYRLGSAIGVTGTPALVTSAGQLMPGYMPALQLAHALGVEVEPELAKELMAKQQAAQQKGH